MNEGLVDRIARAVLYEGYVLYPYRPSVKNRQRWTFGGVYPRAYGESPRGAAAGDAWFMECQCLASGGDNALLRDAVLDVRVRFLHLTDRRVERAGDAAPRENPSFTPVESLETDGRRFQTWQEAEEREVSPGDVSLGELAGHPRSHAFAFPHRRETELIRSDDRQVVGRIVREQQALDGVIEWSAEEKSPSLFAITVRLLNQTPFDASSPQPIYPASPRTDMTLRSFASSHAILQIRGGAFVSLTDPPEALRDDAGRCRNVGCWPVLAGEAGDRTTILASPIILPDYPQIAPESPGDLFDATEIDEILTLRVMTLTDEEKRQAAATDERAREMLARTEALAREQLANLHGTMRR